MLENIDFSLTFLSFILLVCGSRAGLGQVGGKGRLNMLGFFYGVPDSFVQNHTYTFVKLGSCLKIMNTMMIMALTKRPKNHSLMVKYTFILFFPSIHFHFSNFPPKCCARERPYILVHRCKIFWAHLYSRQFFSCNSKNPKIKIHLKSSGIFKICVFFNFR